MVFQTSLGQKLSQLMLANGQLSWLKVTLSNTIIAVCKTNTKEKIWLSSSRTRRSVKDPRGTTAFSVERLLTAGTMRSKIMTSEWENPKRPGAW